MKTNKQWDIRRAVSLAGFFHFLHSFASGCLLPFLTLYLRYLGLTAAMTGIVMAAKHLVALVWRPVSSTLARRLNKRRMIIVGSVICSAITALILLLFPATGVSTESGSCNVSQLNTNYTVYEIDSTTLEPQTSQRQRLSAFVIFSTESNVKSTQVVNDSEHRQALTVNMLGYSNMSTQGEEEAALQTKSAHIHSLERRGRSLGKQEQPQEEMAEAHSEFLGSLKVMDAQHQMFFLVLIVICLWEVMTAPLEYTADDGLHEYLDFVDATDRHGTVKPWRLLGAAGGMGSTGILVSIFYCFTGTVLHFYAYTALMLLMVPFAVLLPLYRHKRERLPGGGLKALQLVRGDSRALLCAITALLTGIAGSVVSDFLLWQMEDHSASELQMGIILAVAPLCQAVFAPWNGTLTRFLKSHGRLLLLSILGLALCSLYYSFLWTPWATLPAQVLAGLSTSALWWSVEAQSVDIASPGTERAIYRVFEALSLDLGAGLGSLMGGFVVQKFGLAVLFQGTAVMLALWCVALAVLQWRIPRQRRINYSRLLAADANEVSDSDSDQDNDWLEKAMEEDKGNNNWKRLD